MTELWQLADGISLLSFVPAASPLLPFSPGPQSRTRAALALLEAEQRHKCSVLTGVPGGHPGMVAEAHVLGERAACKCTEVPATLHLQWAPGCQEGLGMSWVKTG